MKNLPIGISTLSTILESNMVYVDKTELVEKLIKNPGRYFLSRPRRFGKSLLVDTFKEIFQGNQKLFQGLYIHDKWDWDKNYPVIKISFGAVDAGSPETLERDCITIFNFIQRDWKISFQEGTAKGRFIELIQILKEKYNEKVVILIDEYDKPLLDNIENKNNLYPIRDYLRSFYSVIKDHDDHIQFVFVTGVSKFSKVSIFSGINNLKDLTLDANYATICGYTQNDLETVFREHLEGVNWEELKDWYNGYNFLGEKVYNPFDILLFISENKTYRNFWFETGTPTFLIKLFQKNKYFLPELENIEVGEEILSSFEIDKIELTTLLFQTGYLTIKKTKRDYNQFIYLLGYPNEEVKTSLNKYLITGYTDISERKVHYQKSTYYALLNGDLPGLEKAIQRLFAGIPYRNFTNNDLPDSEGYYASVLYAFFASINGEVIPEDISNHGQCDITVKIGDNIFVMEIKAIADGSTLSPEANSALEQIVGMNYSEKYKGLKDKGVFEVGMIFSRSTRNLVRFGWRKV